MNSMFNTNVLIGKSWQNATTYLAKADPTLSLFVERQDDKSFKCDSPVPTTQINVVIERDRIIEAFFEVERKVILPKFDCQALIGQSVKTAIENVSNDGKFTNITKVDEKFIPENCDFCHVPGRINLQIENGIVVHASEG